MVEKETKTKAYSKEGLTSGGRLDPAERKRAETSQWLNQCLDAINLQIDTFETEIESLNTSKKKKNRNENAEAIEEYQRLLEKHRDHVLKLETILRMLDNDTVNMDQVRVMQMNGRRLTRQLLIFRVRYRSKISRMTWSITLKIVKTPTSLRMSSYMKTLMV